MKRITVFSIVSAIVALLLIGFGILCATTELGWKPCGPDIVHILPCAPGRCGSIQSWVYLLFVGGVAFAVLSVVLFVMSRKKSVKK